MSSKLRAAIRGTLNNNLIRDLKISDKNIERLVDLHLEKHNLFKKMRKAATNEDLQKLSELAAEVTVIEFLLQDTWGFPRELKYHKFWELPGCNCPVFDNSEVWPAEVYWRSSSCPIHGKKKKKPV